MRASLVLVAILTLWVFPTFSSADTLKPGYVVCESGGQLRWFIDLKSMDDLWKPHPKNWKLPVHLDSGTHFRSEAAKALQRVWCTATSDLGSYTAEVLENCDKHLPYPNGGCRKIRIHPGKSQHWTTWYTFGDAILK